MHPILQLTYKGTPVPETNRSPWIITEGSLEVKLPTTGQMKKHRWKSQRREENKEDQRREGVRRKEDAGPEKVDKSRNTLFFQ